jgi:hypothetical protein
MFPYNLIVLIFCKAIVLDSSFLTVDVANAHVAEVALGEQIIDHVLDDYLYVSTNNNLYKIDPSEPVLIDKTPLPMRFNYLMLKGSEIILIATNEVIILDRNNLAFKSGVGLEYGDHQPIVKDQSFATTPVRNYIYLASDAGERSIIRIIDLRSGRLVRRAKIDRVKSFDYDAKSQCFVALDVKNNILIFDLYMSRKRKIELGVAAHAVSIHPDGFLIHYDQGILLMNQGGNVIDFQPMPHTFNQAGLLVLSREAIIGFDNITLRPNGWLMNRQNLVQLYPCVSSQHEIGIDPQNNLYIVHQEPMNITPLARKEVQLKRASATLATSDSLWYLQLGAFSNPGNAQLALDALRLNGLPAFIDSADLYRIKFGGFLDKFTGLHIAEKMNLKGWFVYEHKLSGKKLEAFYVGTERYLIQDGVIRKE